MGERLREVPQMPPCRRVVFLGIEAERRGDPQQPFHQVMGSLHLSHNHERRQEPERADHERSLLAGESVVGLVGAVTEDEAVLCQSLGDGKNGVPQALVIMRKELEAPGQQRRRVERIRLVVLAQYAPVTYAVSEDILLDLVRRCAPCRRLIWLATDLCQPARAVEGNPAHQLGGHIVLRLATGLPDALVRVAPDAGGARSLRLDNRPEPARQTLVVAGGGGGGGGERGRGRRFGVAGRRDAPPAPGGPPRSPAGRSRASACSAPRAPR